MILVELIDNHMFSNMTGFIIFHCGLREKQYSNPKFSVSLSQSTAGYRPHI